MGIDDDHNLQEWDLRLSVDTGEQLWKFWHWAIEYGDDDDDEHSNDGDDDDDDDDEDGNDSGQFATLMIMVINEFSMITMVVWSLQKQTQSNSNQI